MNKDKETLLHHHESLTHSNKNNKHIEILDTNSKKYILEDQNNSDPEAPQYSPWQKS